MTKQELAAVRGKVTAYFDEREKEVRSGMSSRNLQLASMPALRLELGVRSGVIEDLQAGSDEEQELYEYIITRYELICDLYCARNIMNSKQREQLDKTIFAKAGGSKRQQIVVNFPIWNAPDDYFDYLKWKAEKENAENAKA